MDDESGSEQAPAGWYADSNMANTQRYWDGKSWTDDVAPLGASQQPASSKPEQQSQLVTVGILAASIVGVIMAMQSASLLTGTGTQWTGTAIAGAAACATFVLRKSIPTWLRIVAVIATLLAIANVIYLENQLDEKRQELTEFSP